MVGGMRIKRVPLTRPKIYPVPKNKGSLAAFEEAWQDAVRNSLPSDMVWLHSIVKINERPKRAYWPPVTKSETGLHEKLAFLAQSGFLLYLARYCSHLRL